MLRWQVARGGLGHREKKGKGLSLVDVLRLDRKVVSPEEGTTQPGSSATELGKGGCYLRLRALGLCRSSGLCQHGGPHPAPHLCPGPNPAPGRSLACTPPPSCEVRQGGGGLSPPSAPGLGCAAEAASLLQDRAGRVAPGGRKQTRGASLRFPAATGGGFGAARSLVQHAHTAAQGHTDSAARGHTHRETRLGARSAAHTLQPVRLWARIRGLRARLHLQSRRPAARTSPEASR